MRIRRPKSFSDDPIMNIEWFNVSELQFNDWNPNVVMNQELRLLETSILVNGWIQPVLINRAKMVIDGFHRCKLAGEPRLRARYAGMVPCCVLDIDDKAAMLLTVRINRAKGSHVAFRMSALVTRLIDVCGASRAEIMDAIGAGADEVDLLYQQGVFEARVPTGYRYSKAWVPEESNGTRKKYREE